MTKGICSPEMDTPVIRSWLAERPQPIRELAGKYPLGLMVMTPEDTYIVVGYGDKADYLVIVPHSRIGTTEWGGLAFDEADKRSIAVDKVGKVLPLAPTTETPQ